MKKFFDFDNKEKRVIKLFFVCTIIVALVIYVVFNNSKLLKLIGIIAGVCTPFIIGIVISFILNRPIEFIQRKLEKTKLRKFKKPIAITFMYLVVLGIIVFFINLVVPQFVAILPDLADAFVEQLTRVINYFENKFDDVNVADQIATAWEKVKDSFQSNLDSILTNILKILTNVFKTIINIILGIVIAVYLSIDKKRILRQTRKLNFALFNKTIANKLVYIVGLINEKFSKFITGQLTVSFILATLSFITMSLFGMKNALVISVIVGLCNTIPYFGPWIGSVPGFVILFAINPVHAFIFVIIMIVLQQIDNAVISPKIVGSSVGLPPFWIIFAITVGGGLFGLPGMIFGTPAFSVIYVLFGEFVDFLLKKRGNTDCIDPPSELKEKAEDVAIKSKVGN